MSKAKLVNTTLKSPPKMIFLMILFNSNNITCYIVLKTTWTLCCILEKFFIYIYFSFITQSGVFFFISVLILKLFQSAT